MKGVLRNIPASVNPVGKAGVRFAAAAAVNTAYGVTMPPNTSQIAIVAAGHFGNPKPRDVIICGRLGFAAPLCKIKILN